MKSLIPAAFAVGLILLLFPVLPTQVTVITWLILITLVIAKWDTLKSNFS